MASSSAAPAHSPQKGQHEQTRVARGLRARHAVLAPPVSAPPPPPAPSPQADLGESDPDAAAWPAAMAAALPALRPPAQRTGGSGAHALLFPHQAELVFEAVRRVALEPDLPSAGFLARCLVADLTASERVHCLFREVGSGALWALEDDAPVSRPSNDAGITTFAARTGAPVVAERAIDAPLYHPELDDPDGNGNERLMAQPVFSAGTVIGVIAAVRGAESPPYSPAERLMLAAFAEHGGPILQHFLFAHQRRARAEVAAAAMTAAAAMAAGQDRGPAARTSDAVRQTPSWIRWSYRLLLAVAATGLVFAALARVPRTSAGPAAVRFEGVPITTPEAGTVTAVRVNPGDRVRKGDVLVDFRAGPDDGAVAQLEMIHARRQAAFQRAPTDERARRALAEVAARLERARAAADERSARSPRDGVIADVRVRPGMELAPADVLVSVIDPATEPTAVILLPGGDRAYLRDGMRVRLHLGGSSGAELRGVVEEVLGELIDAGEARRLLGSGIGDAVAIGAPVVAVRARLKRGARLDDAALRDGIPESLPGRAEVEIGSRSLLAALVPGGD